MHNARIYGFKLKVGQFVSSNKLKNYKAVIEKLYRQGWKFIYVKRENFVKQAFSHYRAEQLEIFELKNPKAARKVKIDVDPEEFLNLIKIYEWNLQVEQDAISSLSPLPIVYEKDLLDPEKHQNTADKVFNFLDLEPVSVETDLIKISDNRLSNNIQNYKDVETLLRENGYYKYLQ